MSDQARALRGLMERRLATSVLDAMPESTSKATTIALTSGKGGVGKSNIALNVALALAEQDASVCLLDANLGLGNIDLLCGLNGYWNLSHVISGARTLKEIVLTAPGGVHVIPGASGLNDLADCPPTACREIFSQLKEFEQTHDFIVIDSGTGIHQSIRQFVQAADVVLVVTTPEPTSIADAYATVKALAHTEIGNLMALVNQVGSTQQGRAILDRLQQTARMFLNTEVGSAGSIPYDPLVTEAVSRRCPFLVDNLRSPAATSIRQLARRLKNMAEHRPYRESFFGRLLEQFRPNFGDPSDEENLSKISGAPL